jgi:gliding motility-associated-like protein
VKDGNGCVFKDTVTIPTPLPVEVRLGADTSILIGDSLLLTPEVDNAFAPVVFEWQTVLVETTSCVDAPECSMLWAKPLRNNTYRVTVTDAHGCSAETDIRVEVVQPQGVYVPTGFSPNGDFNNDLLLVHAQSRGVVEIRRFSVYDRWGEEVYSDHNFPPNDPNRGWDGTFRGQPCDPGVFGWWLEVAYADGQFNTITGNTTLIR